jgi:hypothetical protein
LIPHLKTAKIRAPRGPAKESNAPMNELPDSVKKEIEELETKLLRPKVEAEGVRGAIIRGNPGFQGFLDEISKFFPITSRLRFMFFPNNGAAMVYTPIGGLTIHLASIHDWLGQLCIVLRVSEIPVFLVPAPSEAALCVFFSQIDSYLLNMFGEFSPSEGHIPPDEILAKAFPIPALVANSALSALVASAESGKRRVSPPAYRPMMSYCGDDVYDCRPLVAGGNEAGDFTEILVPYARQPLSDKKSLILAVGRNSGKSYWEAFFIAPDGTPDGNTLQNMKVPKDVAIKIDPRGYAQANILPASSTIN